MLNISMDTAKPFYYNISNKLHKYRLLCLIVKLTNYMFKHS